jgi:predicted SnoaL-like aldol condensation-catalyzing enzyme
MLAGIAAEKLAHNYKLGVFEMKHSHAYKGNDAFVRMFCSLLRMQPRLLPAAKYSTVGVQAAQDIVDEMIRRGFKEKEFEALITMYLLHLMQKELKN